MKVSECAYVLSVSVSLSLSVSLFLSFCLSVSLSLCLDPIHVHSFETLCLFSIAHPLPFQIDPESPSGGRGIAAGEVLLLHAKVHDPIHLCRDVFGKHFVISMACEAPLVKVHS